MKNLLLSLLILGFPQVYAQLPSNCNVPPVLRTYYDSDVKDIAVEWLFTIHSPDTALIDIPIWCQDTIYSGLAAIFNRCDLPEADSVFNKYCVHREWGIINTKQIVVHVDTSYTWTKNWFNLQITTGIPALDTLLAKYGFTVSNAYNWTHPPTVMLSTNQMINLFALCDSIEYFTGVISAGPDGWGGSGIPSHIAFSDTGQLKYYTFTFGWSEAGRHDWVFKVNPGCSIQFLGNGLGLWTEPLPVPLNCNILNIPLPSVSADIVEIYPNPSTGTLNITLPNNFSHCIISLVNINGQEILRKTTFQQQTKLNIDNLSTGVYFVKLQFDNAFEVRKLFKE